METITKISETEFKVEEVVEITTNIEEINQEILVKTDLARQVQADIDTLQARLDGYNAEIAKLEDRIVSAKSKGVKEVSEVISIDTPVKEDVVEEIVK